MIEAQDRGERQELCRLLQEGLDSCLTPVQRRRLWPYCVEGLTVRQIARLEGASFQSIAKAAAAAKKKWKIFGEVMRQNPVSRTLSEGHSQEGPSPFGL